MAKEKSWNMKFSSLTIEPVRHDPGHAAFFKTCEIELNTKSSTKRQQSSRLFEFLVFNLAFGKGNYHKSNQKILTRRVRCPPFFQNGLSEFLVFALTFSKQNKTTTTGRVIRACVCLKVDCKTFGYSSGSCLYFGNR